MSILLNALNKSKQQDDDTSEIETLIDSPIDESGHGESSGRGQPHWLLVLLLSLIVVLLASIAYLLLRTTSPVAEQAVTETSRSSSRAVASHQSVANKQSDITASTDNAISRQEQDKSNLASGAPTKENQSGESERQYFEAYKPERQPRKTVSQRSDNKQPVETARPTNTAEHNSTSSQNVSRSAINTNLPIKTLKQLTQVEQMMVNEITIDAHVYSEDPTQRFIFVAGELKQEGDRMVNSWLLEAIEESTVIVNNGVLRVRLSP